MFQSEEHPTKSVVSLYSQSQCQSCCFGQRLPSAFHPAGHCAGAALCSVMAVHALTFRPAKNLTRTSQVTSLQFSPSLHCRLTTAKSVSLFHVEVEMHCSSVLADTSSLSSAALKWFSSLFCFLLPPFFLLYLMDLLSVLVMWRLPKDWSGWSPRSSFQWSPFTACQF